MKAEGEIARMAVTYLRCRSIAAPVSLAMFVATGSFRGFKDTKYAALLFICMMHGHAWHATGLHGRTYIYNAIRWHHHSVLLVCMCVCLC